MSVAHAHPRSSAFRPPDADVVRRVLGRARLSPGCWEFPGYKQDGYGRVGWRTADGYRRLMAHVAVWRMQHGDVPAGASVLHRCGNRSCVRPSHLYAGDAVANAVDRAADGTTARGERNGRAQLSPALVRELRERRRDGVSYRQIGREFGISAQSARAAATGATWAHV